MKVRIKNPIWGVPITFLNKYNPTQFEIIGLMSGAKDSSLINGNDGRAKFYINGKGVYARILIRKIMKQIHFDIEFDNIFSEVKLKNNSIIKISLFQSLKG